MRKRAAAILLALCMALTLLPTAAFATEEGGAAAPVEQPTQQEEKQEGQQEQPEETPEQPEEQPEAKPAEQPEQQQESAAQGGPAVQSNETGIALLADEHKHCICGGSVTAGDHTSHSDVAYQPWNGTDGISYTNNTAYVYLTGNATIGGHLTVDGKTLYLCLNGKTLSSNGTAKIQVKNGGRLVLCDCQGGGTVKGATSGWGGMCVYLYNSTLDMFGGKLTGGKVTGKGGGGAIALDDQQCIFNMYGGEISGNNGNNYGGAIFRKFNANMPNTTGGTFNMYGGTISGNSAAQGGGVYSWGRGTTFTMSGGVIGGTKENSVNTAEYYGGGVSNQSDSTFTMSGGLIAGNKVTASDIGAGGGVFNNATFTMSGGKIGGSEAGKNTSANLGGGVYTSGTFTMSGSAEVSYNTAASKGGGVYNNCNTFSLTDGSITNNTAATGGGVYCDRSETNPGNVTLSGKARIANNHAGNASSNLYLLEKGTVAASDLTTGAGIGVSTEVDVAGSQLNVAVTSDAVSANYFTSDNTTYITQIAGNSGTGYVVLTQRSASTTHNHSCVCGAVHAQSNGHDTEENLTNWVGISDLNLITGAGNYYLTDNVTLTEAIAYDSGSYCGWKVPDGVVLCLNGKNITMQNPDDLVSESGKAKNADVILVTGRFTLTDCTGAQGKITHATGKIGRGITVLGGTFDMYGGSITGNHTAGSGGGVNVNAGTITVGGNVNISGNWKGNAQSSASNNNANNVYLPTNSTITIEKALAGAPIGITTANAPTAGNPVTIVTGNSIEETYKARFQADNAAYGVSYNSTDKVLQLHKHSGGTATCMAPAVCTTCGQSYGNKNPNNHDIEHHEAKAATCTEVGWNAYNTCKREGCSYTTYKEIAALNHAFAAAWEHNDDKHWRKCTRDGCTGIDAEAAHTYGETWVKGQDGHWKVCEVCQNQSEVEPHNWRDATTSAPKTCTVCGATQGEPLTRSYYYYAPSAAEDKKDSPKAGDPGVLLYAGLALASLTGLTYTAKKRH